MISLLTNAMIGCSNISSLKWGGVTVDTTAVTKSFRPCATRLIIMGCIAVPDMISGRLRLASDIWMLAQTAYHLHTGAEPKKNPAKLPTRCTDTAETQLV